MILHGGIPTAVLRVFFDMLPNSRHVSRETTFRDRGKLKAINKLTGASGAASVSAAGNAGPTHLAAQYAASIAASSTAPAPLGTEDRSVSLARGGGGGAFARYPGFGFPSVPTSTTLRPPMQTVAPTPPTLTATGPEKAGCRATALPRPTVRLPKGKNTRTTSGKPSRT